MSRLISRQEAARLLDVSTQTVTNWIEKGYIKGHVIDKHIMGHLHNHVGLTENFDQSENEEFQVTCITKWD